MKEYENNPFTLSFGNKPVEYIDRITDEKWLTESIAKKPPLSYFYVITGIRGSGKTVMLTNIANYFENADDFIVVELNPEDDIREALAAKIYSKCRIKRIFMEANFSFSFQGLSFSLKGKNPILNIDDLLDKMFTELKKQNKKVLVLIDEATNNKYLKQFALSMQILIRKNYDLFVVMTSLFENISAIENENNLTFLIRAPKIYLKNLNIVSIANSYKEILKVDYEKALEFAKLTKGYAFAFQLLGYLLYNETARDITNSVLQAFDQYLEEYVYSKIWISLSNVEQEILKNVNTNENIDVQSVMIKAKINKQYFSKYRDRLIKKGIIVSQARGTICFALPRFKEFIDSRW